MNRKTRRHLYYDKTADRWVVTLGSDLNRQRKYFRSRQDAEKYMETDAFLVAIGLKKVIAPETPSFESSPSVNEATQWYLNTVTKTMKSRYSQIWEPMVFRKFADYFSDKKIHEIGLAQLLEYQSHLRQKERLAPQTVNRRFNSIRSFFRTFEETKGIPNPCRNLKRLKVPDPKGYDVLDDSEQTKLLLAAKPWLQPIIRLANITGLRRSELTNLRFSAVNLEERYFMVEVSEGFVTKNKKSRRIPMTAQLAKIFYSAVAEAKHSGRLAPEGFVFVDDRGKRITPDRLTRATKRIMKGILGREHGAVHILRHSALTSMIRHGADIESVRRIAGHSSLTVTQKYLAVGDDQMRQAMSRQKPSQIGGSMAISGDENKVEAFG